MIFIAVGKVCHVIRKCPPFIKRAWMNLLCRKKICGGYCLKRCSNTFNGFTIIKESE